MVSFTQIKSLVFPLAFAAMSAISSMAEPIIAPLITSSYAEVVPDSYIVILKDNADLMTHIAKWKAPLYPPGRANFIRTDIVHTFDFGTFKGYAAKLDPQSLLSIRSSQDVEYVEKDHTVHIIDTQESSTWGLDRVSHRELPEGGEYRYIYAPEAGEEVTAYVIDTGVNINHVDFGGRAQWGITIPKNDKDIDGNGHGTHCAGSIAGSMHGVAKKATIKAVKVLNTNGSGTMADVLKGVEWTMKDHQARSLSKSKKTKSVANMSLGGGKSIALDKAVDAAVASGIHFAVAAGNDSDDACDYSPAASQLAVTVGASNKIDEVAFFSNHGNCVDIFAPGQDIKSTWIGSSNTVEKTISGTSMASPHIAGVMALLISQPEYENFTPLELKEKMIEMSSKDLLKSFPDRYGGFNRLVFTNPPTEF